MKKNTLIYEEPIAEVYVFEAGDITTFSEGDPTKENIGKDDYDGNW